MSAPGRIILLNGASSSGKSTLARALQGALDTPFLVLSSDQWVDGGMLPGRRDDDGPFDWVGAMRPRFFDGFHRTIAAMVDAGNDLIVDHIIEHASWRTELAERLWGRDVFLVGVHCDLDELDRREYARGDRAPGEGRAHVEVDGIHTLGPYDVEVDTSSGVDVGTAGQVLTAWRARSGRSVLFGRSGRDEREHPETIRPFVETDTDAVVAFSLRAWGPVFASMQTVLGPALARELNGPDWRVTQEKAVRDTLATDTVWIADVGGTPVGFAATAVRDATTGEMTMLAVDPDVAGRGIGTRLTEHCTRTLREQGVRVAMVETGGDPGHAPARHVYTAAGYTQMPIARYFRTL